VTDRCHGDEAAIMPIHHVSKLIGLASCAVSLYASAEALAQAPGSAAAAPPSQPTAATPTAAFPPAANQLQPAAPAPAQAAPPTAQPAQAPAAQPAQAPAVVQAAPEAYPAAPAPMQLDPSGTLEAPQPPKPRQFALGLALLKEHGFGGLLRLRFNHVALDATGGFMPLLIITQTVDGTTMDVDGALSAHGGIGPVFFFNGDQKKFQNGIRVNGIYDQIMGPGGGAGWVGEFTKTSFTLALGAGIQVYPEAEDRIRKHFGYSSAIKLDPTSTVLQVYVGLNLFWYLV
jgi:hypothetical protein